MDVKATGLALILISIVLLTLTQLVIKSRLSAHGVVPFSPGELLSYCWKLAQDWRLLLGLATLVVAAFCWYAAISRLPLSMAYPFAALSYPLVYLGAVVYLREVASLQTLLGNLLIVLGVLLVAAAPHS